MSDKLSISTAPFLHGKDTTSKIMFEVVYTLLPIVAVSYYFFGLAAFMLTISCIVGCGVTEYIFDTDGKKGRSLKDGSALITGILLALTLPPGFPLWMAFLGGVVAIGMGKVMWGGLGQNVFNPALLGRAFLQAAFPTAITTWTLPDQQFFNFRGTNLAMPLYQGENVDAVTASTPLAKMKFAHILTNYSELLFGNTGGSLGETCGIIIILAGIYLVVRKIIHWRIPISIMLSASIFSGILWFIDPTIYPSPLFMILSGGMLLGAVYMATDLVTSPLTAKGCWIFGIGIGILIVLIRVWGGLPEGVMYAILLMNSATPLINKYAKNRVYGT